VYGKIVPDTFPTRNLLLICSHIWRDAVTLTRVFDRLVVSVVDPALVDESLRDAQTALNNYAVSQAQSLVPNDLNSVIKVIRTDPLDAPIPKGTVKIQYDRQIEAEGTVVWPSRNPTPPSGCLNQADPDNGIGNYCYCPDGSCWLNLPGGDQPCDPPLDVPITCGDP
jgi:hypothetical protein